MLLTVREHHVADALRLQLALALALLPGERPEVGQDVRILVQQRRQPVARVGEGTVKLTGRARDAGRVRLPP